MPKLAPLLFAFVVMASVGLILEVVRSHVFAYIDVYMEMKLLPKLSWALIQLPSNEYYSRFQVYVLLFLLPWLVIALKAGSMTIEKLWRVSGVAAALALAIGGLVATAMITPCMPRLKLLYPDEYPSTWVADGIALTFALLTVAVLIRFVMGLRKRYPSNE